MPLVPIAAFLAGALLTLLLPVALLIALVVWYWLFSVRVPETGDGPKADAPAHDPGVPISAHGAAAAVPSTGPGAPAGSVSDPGPTTAAEPGTSHTPGAA